MPQASIIERQLRSMLPKAGRRHSQKPPAARNSLKYPVLEDDPRIMADGLRIRTVELWRGFPDDDHD